MEPRAQTPARPSPPLPAQDWALFFDVDGCLLDFSTHPAEVLVPPTLQDDIARLHEHLGGALAIVSGRALDSIDEVFPRLLHIPAAGMHGLERRDADGRRTTPPHAPPNLMDVEAEAVRIALAFPGAIIERKGPNLALHWRAAPAAEERLRAFAAAALRVLPEYRVQAGDEVLELRPGGQTPDKGGAVERFLEHLPFRGRRPVFIGDDLTDEHAFDVVNARDGLSVLVGAREPSAARWHLDNPTSVRAWISRATAHLRGGVHA